MTSTMAGRAAALRDHFDRGFAEAPRDADRVCHDFIEIRLGGAPHALRITEIGGVFADRTIARVPCRMPELVGITGFRSRLVPVFDLGAVLGYSAATRRRWLAIDVSHTVGFAFDSFDGHVRVDASEITGCGPGGQAAPHVLELVRLRPIISLPSIIDMLTQRAQVRPTARSE